MPSSFVRGFRNSVITGVALSALVPAIAWAQVDPEKDAQSQKLEANSAGAAVTTSEPPASDDIVVTGTLIRGSAPVGQTVIAVGPEKAQAQGATTSNEILATIPQVSNLFVTAPSSRLAVASNQIQIVRPNLRNLSEETGASSSTLVLFDGHRSVGVGATQSAVDPDALPQGAIERVEVVTDGGSATYGADAVGGVINFITRKRFNGLKLDGRYGIGDDYWSFDANVVAGKDWGRGSLYAAYSFQKNSSFRGRDRDFVRSVDFTTPNLTPTGRSCSPGNVTPVGNPTTFPLNPNGTVGTGAPNACDPTDDSTVYPKVERHSALVSLHQELTDGFTVDLKGFWAKRDSYNSGPLRGTATIRPGQFYYQQIGATAVNQSVAFSLGPLLGNDAASSSSGYEEWGANGEASVKLGGDWEFRGLLNYSQSKAYFSILNLNAGALDAAGRSADPLIAVNFYNPAASNPAAIARITNGELATQGRDQLFQARGIVSGSLFNLPGGAVRLAAGYEYQDETFTRRDSPNNGTIGAVNNLPWNKYGRLSHALFGQVDVPVFGEDNRSPGFYSLIFTGSVRYDHFSDFGSTVNPKFGVNYKPVDWLTLRGNYSTSFQAPPLVTQLSALASTVTLFPLNAFIPPNQAGPAPGSGIVGTLALQGANSGLQPQTASTWSVGADIEPPFIPGLHASMTYYSVDFDNIIGIPPPNSTIFTAFPNNAQADPLGLTVQQIQNFAAIAPTFSSFINNVIAGNCLTPNVPTSRCSIYETVDFRTGNYGTVKVRGLDFSVNYRHNTGWGGWDASVSGNYQLQRKTAPAQGAALNDSLAFNTPKLTMQTTAGADVGNVRGQITWNHVSGYAVQRSAVFPQDEVGAFDIFNLFLRYRVPGDTAFTKDLTFTLNVNNVFNTDPPVFKSNAVGAGNGYPQAEFTIGRVFLIGVQKQF